MFSPSETFVEVEAKIFDCFCLWYDSLTDVDWWAGFLPYGKSDMCGFGLVDFQSPFPCPAFNLV
jgi:hypothetical protein